MSGSNKLNKPKHVKDARWRQHLTWMEVVGKQVNENYVRQVAQAKKNRRKGQ